jgi:hypothetical protein
MRLFMAAARTSEAAGWGACPAAERPTRSAAGQRLRCGGMRDPCASAGRPGPARAHGTAQQQGACAPLHGKHALRGAQAKLSRTAAHTQSRAALAQRDTGAHARNSGTAQLNCGLVCCTHWAKV